MWSSGKSQNRIYGEGFIITIRNLTVFDPDDFRRIFTGYQSLTYYQVHKEETTRRTSITLERKLFAQPYLKVWDHQPEDFARCERLVRSGIALGAWDGTQCVGLAFAEASLWNRTLLVWDIEVEKDHRGQGIGSLLMDELTRLARETGLRALVCETQNTNSPAIDFYYRSGFVLDGVDLSYYTNNDITDFEVAIFMKKKLA